MSVALSLIALTLLGAPQALAGPKAAKPAAPAPCAAQLTALAEAGPSATGKAFVDLATCDAVAAKVAAPEAFKRVLAGESGDAAALAAIGAGSFEIVRGWISALEPDDRSRTISKLGQSCGSAAVPTFFLETHAAIGEKFWSDRWYRGLGECRAPAAQDLLRARVSQPITDRVQYNGVLEIFSRNLGKDAIPTLIAAAQAEKEGEVSAFIVNAFADAAGVGRAAGADAEATKLALAALAQLAPTLPEKGVDQARMTVRALGDDPGSDRLVVVRYKDQVQASGGLLYGVIATEIATCKKGDTRIVIHSAMVNESGHAWPDQVAERISPVVTANFKLGLAAACKGTGAVEITTPPTAFKDAAAYTAWVDGHQRDLQKAHVGVKIKVVPEDALTL